jgi:hypothetical protein
MNEEIMENRKEADKRKQYEKPVVKRFPLRAEEAVLGFCKQQHSSGSTQGQCSAPSPCSLPGS